MKCGVCDHANKSQSSIFTYGRGYAENADWAKIHFKIF